MCGIAGIVLLDKADITASGSEATTAMVVAMEHRGPDSRAVATLGNACFGACRLAILDPERAANQPLRSPDSECVIVFNGEIFNYLELREELIALGHRFNSRGDTEVLLHAFEQWGVECLPRLNGMFAFAVYDGRTRSVFFARDRYGIKPFYYVLRESSFAFASEPIALLKAGLVGTELNDHVVLDYLELGVTDSGEATFLKDIRQLLPGHFGELTCGRVMTTRWYSPGTASARRTALDHEESGVVNFRRLFEDSVRLRMRSDVPVGFLLSGGLDSSGIVGVGSHLFDRRALRAYTVSFPGSPWDESAFATAVAEESSVGLLLETAQDLDMVALKECIVDQGEPFISPSVIAQWLVMKAVHRTGIRVLLSGQGADEYLGGYEYFDAFSVLDWLRKGALGTLLHHLLNERNLRHAPRILAQTFFLMLPGRLRPRFWKKAWLRMPHISQGQCPYLQELLRCRNLHDSLVFHMTRRLSELLRYEDRNSMAFSIETRHPYLDQRLVELALTLPESCIIGEGERKLVLRKALADVLPRKVLERKDKVGFQTPSSWLESEDFRKSFEQLARSAPSVVQKYIKVDKALELFSGRRSRRNSGDLWRIYNLLAWQSEVAMISGQHPSAANSPSE